MAKGYPDFFGTSIWPKYGTPTINTGAAIVVHGGNNDTIILITADGVLFQAAFVIVCDDLANSHYLHLYIDGVLVESEKLDQLYLFTSLGGSCGLMNVIHFDRLLYHYRFELAREIPFHDSIEFKVQNSGAAATHVTVDYKTMHYVVT